MLLFGSGPVAVDVVAHDIIVKERIARGAQQVALMAAEESGEYF